MTPAQMYNCTARQLFNIINGHNDVQNQAHRLQWETARFVAWWAVAPHLGKKSKIKTMHDIATFPWEGGTAHRLRKPPGRLPITRPQLQQIKQQLAQTHEQ